MIYLLLAIACSALISICMRISEKHIKNEMGMFMANYALCILLSFVYGHSHLHLHQQDGPGDPGPL